MKNFGVFFFDSKFCLQQKKVQKNTQKKHQNLTVFFVFFRFKIESLKTRIFSFFESKNIVEFCPKRNRAPYFWRSKRLLANTLHENPRIEKVKKMELSQSQQGFTKVAGKLDTTETRRNAEVATSP